MNSRAKETESTLKGTIGLVIGILVILWLGSFVPDQPWMFDQKPLCAEGSSPVLKGQAFVCRAG